MEHITDSTETAKHFGDSTAVRLGNETFNFEKLGSGDITLTENFLSQEDADNAFLVLNNGGEIQYQQWYHMADKKFNLLPLSRLKIAMADVNDSGLIPHYRFPVNSQDQHGIFSFDTSKTVKKIRDKLIEQTGIPFNHAVVLLYRNENDCIGFHKDKTLDLSKEHPIASISLGQERSYILRDSIHNPTISQEIKLKHGSLLLLGPQTNQNYYHSVPVEKSSTMGSRISITFRVVTTFKNIKTGELVGQGSNISCYNWPEESNSFHVDYYDELLKFWFGTPKPVAQKLAQLAQLSQLEYYSGLWWHGIHPTNHSLQTTSDVDEYIKSKWGKLLKNYDDKLDINLFEEKHFLKLWTKDINGLVALMLLFDQFPRHVYRGDQNAFKFDGLALQIAQHLNEHHFEKLNGAYKMFMYVTFMHSENSDLVSQATLGLLMLAESETNPKWKSGFKKTATVSQEHYNVLKKFGRYPHRNAILKRSNTIEEIDFMAQKNLPLWMRSVNPVNPVNSVNDATHVGTTKEIKQYEQHEPHKSEEQDKVCKKLNILVLHSNRQTSHLFKAKTEKFLEKKLKNIANLTYCNAPKLYEPAGEVEKLIHDKEYSSVPNTGITRAWWNATDDPTSMTYRGLEDSLEYIDSLFRNGAYDGIIGFSQGGTLTGIIASMVHDARKGKQVAVNIDNIGKSLKFVAIISGFYCRDTRQEFRNCILEEVPVSHDPDVVKIRKDLIDIPSFHSWGVADELVNPWRSEKLSEAFAEFDDSKKKQIHVHLSGHFAKAIKFWPVQQMYEWLKLFTVSKSNEKMELFEQCCLNITMNKSSLKICLSEINDDLNEFLVYVIKSQKYGSDFMFDLIGEICENTDELLQILNSNADLWNHMIKLDTEHKNDGFRNLLSNIIAIQLRNEYQKYYVEQKSGVPSQLALCAPKYNALYRQTRLYHDVALSLANILNIFDTSVISINEEHPKRQLLLSYNQYRQVISRLTKLLVPPEPKPTIRKHVPRNNLEDLLKTPLSDYILNPRAEPVDIAPSEMLEPLYEYLREGQNNNEEIVFKKGTICIDGRLDLCKQVIGPNGVSSLIKSLNADSLLSLPKVKHLLLGNNICGNELGTAVGNFIKSGQSALTTWYIAGNNLDVNGISPICDALCEDHKVKQLWLKRNPLREEGMYPIVNMLQHNTYLQILDLTNTGVMDKGASILLNGIVGTQGLKYLYLSSNGLTSETCKIIADMLHTTNLEQIGLGCNRLGNEGAGWLANALSNPLCKLKSLEIASCGIGPKGAKFIADSLTTNKSLISLNMGFLKSTNDLGEIPNIIESNGAVYIADALSVNNTLRLLDLVYTGIQQAGITALSNVLSTKNTTLIYLNLEQFGIPHNELSREIIRKSIQKNKELTSTATLEQIDKIVFPQHLEEIQSVYRVA